jgi:hypothetical protein
MGILWYFSNLLAYCNAILVSTKTSFSHFWHQNQKFSIAEFATNKGYPPSKYTPQTSGYLQICIKKEQSWRNSKFVSFDLVEIIAVEQISIFEHTETESKQKSEKNISVETQ